MRSFASSKLYAETRHRFLRYSVWSCLAFLFVALVISLPVNAQLAGKGTLTGTVTDSTGAVIPGAAITATNTATGISVNIVSTSAGSYTMANLDPGIYNITTIAKGFQKLVQEGLHVNALETANYNPQLTIGSVDTQITVTDVPPQLETSNATLGAVLENETYSELPIEMGAYGQPDQRRASDFAFLMPGVQGNNTNGNATTNTGVVNGSGSRGAASAVYIDGLVFVRGGGNGDPRYVWSAISVDAVDQFQVQTVGYSAVYEGQGVMNYTVKSGGLKMHASVYDFFRNTALDSWGWFGKLNVNPATGKPMKPVEHMNEYGINLSGPLAPFTRLKDKLFVFENYNGYRYSSQTPIAMTVPTLAQRAGDFRGVTDSNGNQIAIYDPLSQAACTSFSSNGPCRYQFGYTHGTGMGPAGNPVLIGASSPVNVIPQSEFSQLALNMQQFLPTPQNSALQNNYVAPNPTSLNNWTNTGRVDYNFLPSDSLSFIAAFGRQASSVPVGQATQGRNVGPVPYNYGQAYAPKTAVFVLEETHTFNSNLINQFKWGYARYNGPTFSPNEQPAYAASKMGVTTAPGQTGPALAGPALDMFPIVQFAGPNAPTNWGGTSPNITIASNFTLLDNVQWNIGKHAFTFGGQIAWILYNNVNGTGGSNPLTFKTAVTETAGIKSSSNTSPSYTATSGTGLAYASYLVGDFDSVSFNQFVLQPEFGARFRAISPYAQDNWKITPKLTLDMGLRYDFFPSVTEVHNTQSFFNPNLANPVTLINGALQYTGHGTNTCNCSTPVNNYMKNWGPRAGIAYQIDSKTVVRASWGLMFTHGNAVGGLNTTIGNLGYSAAPSFGASNLLSTAPFHLNNGALPAYTPAAGAASGPTYGTGNANAAGYYASPASANYLDPYLGGRAPEYENWSIGIQRQIANSITASATYVGSEGHFLQADSLQFRGYWSNQLNPIYLQYGTALGTSGTALRNNCTTLNLPCPANFWAPSSVPAGSAAPPSLSTALKPFPFHSVTDAFGYAGNSNYHSLQLVMNFRNWHGFTLNGSYVWSKVIDNAGSFRTGWPIIPGTLANNPQAAYPATRIERGVSTSSQPQHFTLTSVYQLPIGKTVLNQNAIERAILGGFKLSGIFQAFSGSPLALTEASTQTNPAESTFMAIMNPNFTGSAHQNGKWGHGINLSNYNSTSYIVPSTGTSVATATGPFMAPVSGILSSYAYKFSDAPRTAAYGLYGPGNYQLDLALARSFPLHLTEGSKFDFRAEMFNVTNHTFFAVASTAVGNASFGQVTTNSAANRKAVQFSGRVTF